MIIHTIRIKVRIRMKMKNEIIENPPTIRLKSKPYLAIQLNKYVDNLKEIPKEGSHIIGHQLESDYLVVYQAYNPSIAAYAVENQQFGGKHFSMTRMSWIKPNFLWMMYRCGWAGKENQEKVLAIAISKKFFKKILKQGVLSGFDENEYETREQWKEKLGKSDVRIQWDPDHDPYGAKQNWRAIQIGLRGEMLKDYCTREIYFIEDITDFVKRQKLYVDRKETDKLWIPKERVIEFPD